MTATPGGARQQAKSAGCAPGAQARGVCRRLLQVGLSRVWLGSSFSARGGHRAPVVDRDSLARSTGPAGSAGLAPRDSKRRRRALTFLSKRCPETAFACPGLPRRRRPTLGDSCASGKHQSFPETPEAPMPYPSFPERQRCSSISRVDREDSMGVQWACL